jgi:hypothetical protein
MYTTPAGRGLKKSSGSSNTASFSSLYKLSHSIMSPKMPFLVLALIICGNVMTSPLDFTKGQGLDQNQQLNKLISNIGHKRKFDIPARIRSKSSPVVLSYKTFDSGCVDSDELTVSKAFPKLPTHNKTNDDEDSESEEVSTINGSVSSQAYSDYETGLRNSSSNSFMAQCFKPVQSMEIFLNDGNSTFGSDSASSGQYVTVDANDIDCDDNYNYNSTAPTKFLGNLHFSLNRFFPWIWENQLMILLSFFIAVIIQYSILV